eukprot:4592516-Pyramimonas_sp.AAC.1
MDVVQAESSPFVVGVKGDKLDSADLLPRERKDSPWTTPNCLDFEVSISWKYSMLEQMCSLAP